MKTDEAKCSDPKIQLLVFKINLATWWTAFKKKIETRVFLKDCVSLNVFFKI